MAKAENKNLENPTDVLGLKATGESQTYRYKNITALQVVVSPKGLVIFRMRFRAPDGQLSSMKLGPLDKTKRKHSEAPAIGQALTPQEAVILAGLINAQRNNGIDVAARRHTEKHFAGRGMTFPAQVREFVEADRKLHRRWIETAAALGYRFPWKGDSEPTVIKGGLCDLWGKRTLAEISADDLSLVVRNAQTQGLPGWGTKTNGPRPSRGRRLAAALGSFYKWLLDERRIENNVFRNVRRPKPLKAKERALNTDINVRGADELRWFWAATVKAGYPHGHLCQVLLLTGCRRAEISQMRWDELSDDFSMLHLPGERTKNARPHDVPLAKPVRDILGNVPRLNDTYVFVNPRSNYLGPMGNFSALKGRLDLLMLEEAVRDRNGPVTIPPWDVHDLRRTASTGMNSIGVFPHIVEAALNHISGARNGVAGTYNRAAYTKEKVDAMDRWASYVERIVSGADVRNVVPMRR